MLSRIHVMKQTIQQIQKCQSWLALHAGTEEVVDALEKVAQGIAKQIKKEAA